MTNKIQAELAYSEVSSTTYMCCIITQIIVGDVEELQLLPAFRCFSLCGSAPVYTPGPKVFNQISGMRFSVRALVFGGSAIRDDPHSFTIILRWASASARMVLARFDLS